MFNSFITSVDTIKHHKNNHDTQQNQTNNLLNLKNQIRNLIDTMPPSEICQQAALNIGLPSNLLHFKKISKIIDNQCSNHSLTFTLTQLKALYKQCQKLKKMGAKQLHRSHSPSRQVTQIYQNVNSNSESMNLRAQKREINFQQKLFNALKEQISFRIKVQNFYSTDKLDRKEKYVQKKAEKAKFFNKKALKIYKNYRDKEREEIQLFKQQTIQELQHKPQPQPVQREPRLRKKRYVTNLCCEVIVSKNSDFEQNEDQYKRYNTAQTGRRVQTSLLRREQQYMQNNQRFDEMRRKQLKTREKKRQIQTIKQQTAIFKLIQKQQKLNLITSDHEKKILQKFKKNRNRRRQSLPKQFIIESNKPNQQQTQDLQSKIKSICQQKILKKELILQQKVNRIRNQLKSKEDRVIKNKDDLQRYHANSINFNHNYMKSQKQKVKRAKQQSDFKHESTIRGRLQRGKQIQKYNKIMQNLSKMSEQQIKRQIQKLNNRQYSQSQIFTPNN